MSPRLWVVDASFSGALLLPDEHSEPALELIALARRGAVDLVVNSLWWFEIANLLVCAVQRKRIAPGQVPDAWALVEALPLRTHREDHPAGWSAMTGLAIASKLSAYDASYLSLALALKAGLATPATEDRQLRKAAQKLHIPVWKAG